MRALLDAKANVAARDYIAGSNALMIAATYDHVDVIHALLARGADVNALSSSGNNVLMIATIMNTVNAIYALLANRADVNAVNHVGNSALMIAV